MNHGKGVVAKLPNPNAGRPHSLTASEVAAMDFVKYVASIKVVSGADTCQKPRYVMNLPVPRILDLSSKASETAVEAEYVVMLSVVLTSSRAHCRRLVLRKFRARECLREEVWKIRPQPGHLQRT